MKGDFPGVQRRAVHRVFDEALADAVGLQFAAQALQLRGRAPAPDAAFPAQHTAGRDEARTAAQSELQALARRTASSASPQRDTALSGMS